MRNTFRPSWKVLAAVWNSYSVGSPLTPASEERNSTVDATSGVLKTRKTESFSLQVCKFLIRNPIRDHLLGIFRSFKAHLRNWLGVRF